MPVLGEHPEWLEYTKEAGRLAAKEQAGDEITIEETEQLVVLSRRALDLLRTSTDDVTKWRLILEGSIAVNEARLAHHRGDHAERDRLSEEGARLLRRGQALMAPVKQS